ncbi:WXG100 family type VII secretion target [Actinomadura sp. 6N118]|uniref:WXG100 family type VII secretion target n=1 Tax=Actinomadura sp. 6N118 TaxID=3375151 RepID=UPI0037ADE304
MTQRRWPGLSPAGAIPYAAGHEVPACQLTTIARRTIQLPLEVKTMVRIQAEFAAFREAERNFQRALQEFDSTLDTLQRDLAGSLAEWEGDAQKTYAAARDRWSMSTREMHRELARLHAAIVRAHRNLRSASDTNTRMWSG